MEAAAYLITAMHDRQERIASALWIWLERRKQTVEQLAAFLGCSAPTLERLALIKRPQAGDDWDVDVEIIAISFKLRHAALRALLQEADRPHEREVGA